MTQVGRAIAAILTMRCRQADAVISRPPSDPAPWPERLGATLHAAVCRSCRRARSQVRAIQRTVEDEALTLDAAEGGGLSPEARTRLEQAAQTGGPGSPADTRTGQKPDPGV